MALLEDANDFSCDTTKANHATPPRQRDILDYNHFDRINAKPQNFTLNLEKKVTKNPSDLSHEFISTRVPVFITEAMKTKAPCINTVVHHVYRMVSKCPIMPRWIVRIR